MDNQFVGWVEAIAETHHNLIPMRWVSRCSTHPTHYILLEVNKAWTIRTNQK